MIGRIQDFSEMILFFAITKEEDDGEGDKSELKDILDKEGFVDAFDVEDGKLMPDEVGADILGRVLAVLAD